MRYLTAKEVAQRWGVTVRRVQDMCRSGVVDGVTRHGREWLIPDIVERPPDGRRVPVNSGLSADNLRYRSSLVRYSHPGTADKVLASITEDPVERDMFELQLSFYRGDLERAKAIAHRYKTPDAVPAQRCMVANYLAMCAICDGDLRAWQEARDYLTAVPYASATIKPVMDFWIAANDSVVYDTARFPSWFRRGDFTRLPRSAQPVARFYYVKYLYIVSHEVQRESFLGRTTMDFMRVMPLIIEPLVTQTHMEGVLITEVLLRLMCAAAYHVAGEDKLARSHVEKALDLALPDRLYQPLAEYYHRISTLMDAAMEKRDKQLLTEIRRRSKVYQTGWITLHNAVMKRVVSTELTNRERQIARLAVYGLSNKEIADRLSITVNAVKQALSSAMDKTGAENRAGLQRFV